MKHFNKNWLHLFVSCRNEHCQLFTWLKIILQNGQVSLWFCSIFLLSHKKTLSVIYMIEGFITNEQHSERFCSTFLLFQKKILSCLRDWRLYYKWIILRKVLFNFCPYPKENIVSCLQDWRLDYKWIILIKILFTCYLFSEENIVSCLHD